MPMPGATNSYAVSSLQSQRLDPQIVDAVLRPRRPLRLRNQPRLLRAPRPRRARHGPGNRGRNRAPGQGRRANATRRLTRGGPAAQSDESAYGLGSSDAHARPRERARDLQHVLAFRQLPDVSATAHTTVRTDSSVMWLQ